MAYKYPSFTKLIGDSLVYNDEGTFCFYVPEIYFDRNSAKQEGDIIEVFGIIDWTIMKNGSNNGLHRFNLPTIFHTKPCKTTKLKKIKLTKNSDPADYRILEYNKGDPIFTTVNLVKDVVNVEEFFKILKSGRLPETVKYDKFQDYFYDAFNYAGTSYKLHSQLLGVMASEYFRSKTDLKKPYRLTTMNDMTGYTLVNIADLPKYISPYAAIGSENWDNAVVGALTLDKGPKSPLEKMLMESAGHGSL